MAKGKHKMGRNGSIMLAGGLAITALLLVIFAPQLQALLNPTPAIPLVPAPFGTVAKDINRNAIVDKGDIVTELWLYPEDGTDIEDWSQYELQDGSGDSEDVDVLEDISVEMMARIRLHFTRAVIIYSCAAGTDIVDDDDGVIYYERQMLLNMNGPNVVELYETPSVAGFAIFNTNTGAVIAITANISKNVNFTVVMMTNATQEHAAYKSYFNYEDGALSSLKMVFNFNVTCKAAELSAPNTVRAHPVVDRITLGFDYLGATPVLMPVTWCASPTNAVIDENDPILLQFDEITI
jgi:hypothetical protein